MTGEAAAGRDIPNPVKREVRQRCGFGCVLCGLPLYEYEHILGFANVRRHIADEITLLCDRHHSEKTKGLLPPDVVAAADADPINRRAGASSPYTLHYSGEMCEARLGSNLFTASTAGDFVAVMVDSVPLIAFRFEDGHYLLNVRLFDELNRPVLQIADNELVYSAEPWDIEFIGHRLTLRAAARRIFVEIDFLPPSTVSFVRGRLLLNGVEIFLRPDYVLVVNNGSLLASNIVDGYPVALNLGHDVRNLPSAVRIQGLRRYGVDRAAALRWAVIQTRERRGQGRPEACEQKP